MAAPASIKAIVIGGSAGGLEALAEILAGLDAAFDIPIALVLHLPPHRPSLLPEVLANKCRLVVREPDDKDAMARGTLYVAPSNYHLLIERDLVLSLSVDDFVLFSRPSIDVLFESAADALGPGVAAVLLTGANEDGARGLAAIKQAGGVTIVQSPESAAVSTMPEAGIRMAAPDHVLAPAAIGRLLNELQRGSR